jgi:hypothetical protein
MMASWNVVSIYSNVGTDFPELHKAIVDLKSVLQDFEGSLGARVERKEPKPRRDLVPSSHPASHDGANDGADDGEGEGEGVGAGAEERHSAQPILEAPQDHGAEDPNAAHYSDVEMEVEPEQQEQDDEEVEAQ